MKANGFMSRELCRYSDVNWLTLFVSWILEWILHMNIDSEVATNNELKAIGDRKEIKGRGGV